MAIAEAYCLLDIARAEREVEQAKKSLADSRADALLQRVKLLRLQAKTAAKRVIGVERSIGRMRYELRKNGYTPYTSAAAFGVLNTLSSGGCVLTDSLVLNSLALNTFSSSINVDPFEMEIEAAEFTQAHILAA